jgi:hemoglobin
VPDTVPTLYEWCGGSPALHRLTDVFYRWLGEVFGGPTDYTDQLGGYPAMLSHHLGLAISDEQRARWAQLIAQSADEAGLPDDPEFRSAFVAYV